MAPWSKLKTPVEELWAPGLGRLSRHGLMLVKERIGDVPGASVRAETRHRWLPEAFL